MIVQSVHASFAEYVGQLCEVKVADGNHGEHSLPARIDDLVKQPTVTFTARDCADFVEDQQINLGVAIEDAVAAGRCSP